MSHITCWPGPFAGNDIMSGYHYDFVLPLLRNFSSISAFSLPHAVIIYYHRVEGRSSFITMTVWEGSQVTPQGRHW